MGAAFAFLALLCWGLGDFLIQRSARKFGDAIALFYICAFASVALLPFIYRELLQLRQGEAWLILILATLLTLFAALFDFEALRIGKISVIEPVYAFEVIVTSVLGAVLIREFLNILQVVLILLLFLGIFLVSLKSMQHLKEFKWERGVWYAVLATVGMGFVNFLFGVGSRETSPLLINWFTSCGITLVLLVYLVRQQRLSELVRDFRRHKELVVGVSVVDNLAWVAFSYSVLYIPIAIATGISESYIALAAGLGLLFNHEKLKAHQVLGFVLALSAALVLSFTA